jgi:hypothetical protein
VGVLYGTELMPLSRLELGGAAAILLLTGAGLARLAAPPRAKLHQLSVEGIKIKSVTIGTGDVATLEGQWHPVGDVYVVGWAYSIDGHGGSPELVLRHKDTILFYGPKGGTPTVTPSFYQAGAGYWVPAGDAVTLRLVMRNTGPPGQTPETSALVYFVPAEDN